MQDASTDKILKPIVLVGMMGVGKTTYGRKVSAILGVPFIDIDQAIENEIGHSISWIFENAGEDSFRQMEENKIKEALEAQKPMVLALGGGAFLNETTRALIKKAAISVWLSSAAEVIFNRVSVRKDRPLLEGVEDKLGKIKDIMDARADFYNQADVKIMTDTGNQREIATKIIKEVGNFLAQDYSRNS